MTVGSNPFLRSVEKGSPSLVTRTAFVSGRVESAVLRRVSQGFVEVVRERSQHCSRQKHAKSSIICVEQPLRKSKITPKH
jgi:hypothetical protein